MQWVPWIHSQDLQVNFSKKKKSAFFLKIVKLKRILQHILRHWNYIFRYALLQCYLVKRHSKWFTTKSLIVILYYWKINCKIVHRAILVCTRLCDQNIDPSLNCSDADVISKMTKCKQRNGMWKLEKKLLTKSLKFERQFSLFRMFSFLSKSIRRRVKRQKKHCRWIENCKRLVKDLCQNYRR